MLVAVVMRTVISSLLACFSMALTLLSLSTALLQLSVVTVAAMDKCDTVAEQAVSNCLQPMLKFADKIEQNSNEMQFAWHGNAISKRLCQIYKQFKKCSYNVGCSSRTVNAMDASYGYMCGNGYSLFQKHSDCFAEVETKESYISCKRMASTAITKANTLKSEDNLQNYFDELCASMKRYLECSKPVINGHCGNEAWTFVSLVTSDSLRAALPKCQIDE